MAARPRHPAEPGGAPRAARPRPPPAAAPGALRGPPPPEPDLALDFEPALAPTALAALRALDHGAGEILRVMLDLFLDDGYEMILLIEDAICSNDADQLHTYAHLLATTAAQLGAADLTAICLDLEPLAAGGQATQAALHMDALRKAFDLAEAEIHELLADGH